MSDFSTMCKEAIKDAGLSIYQISKISGLDRTTMQKMISGSKLPSYSFFYNFLDQLRLNEKEKIRMKEVFQIEKDGFGAFNNRQKIKEMIQNLGKKREVPKSLVYNTEEIAHAENSGELIQMIYGSMRSCLLQKRDSTFRINIPQQLDFFYTIIQGLSDDFSSDNVVDFSVEQIVMLNKNPMYSQDSNVNLNYLSQVLYLADCLGDRYQAYYQYVRGNERDYDVMLWPYYILMPGKIIFISADCKSGYVETNSYLVKKALCNFSELRKGLTQFYHAYSDYMQAFTVYFDNYRTLGMPNFIIENSPCITLMYEEGMLQFPFAGLPDSFLPLLHQVQEFYDVMKEIEFFPDLFFTEDGMREFLEEGVLVGGIADFIGKIPPEMRKPMMKKFLNEIGKPSKSAHILEDNQIKLDRPIMMELYGSNRISLFTRTQRGGILYVEIDETSVCEAFLDFADHLEELKMASSKLETMKRIEKAIGE